MKTLIAGTVCFILTSLWIELSTQKPPSALLLLAISLFLMLKGYLKIKSNEQNKETD